MTQEFKSFVGIDVSESWLEVCVLPEATRRRFCQDAGGWQDLCQAVGELTAPLVVMEATGGLERPLAQLLSGAAPAPAGAAGQRGGQPAAARRRARDPGQR